jgi:hypothetical protein
VKKIRYGIYESKHLVRNFAFCSEPFPAGFPIQLALANANLIPSKLNTIWTTS